MSHSDSEQRNKKKRKFQEKKKHPYKKGGRTRTLDFSKK
jgi:hypothetical protein